MSAGRQNEYIVLDPVAKIPAAVIESISLEIERIYGWRTQVRSLLGDLEFAFDARREQYHSTAILERLAGKSPPDALKVLAITDVDLFIPILTYVYGEAQLGGMACIISTHRLRTGAGRDGESDKDLEVRVVKEAVHELGHTFNLRHCPEHACIMHYCRSLDDVDRKSDRLCRHCKVLLGDEVKRIRSKKR